MAVDTIFVYHFVNAGLRIEKFFKKEEATETGSVDFEIGDISTST